MNTHPTLKIPRCLTLRISAIVFNQPKHSSIRFLFPWLIAYPACRVVRLSIALPPGRFSFCAPCGVTFRLRHSPTKSAVSYNLSVPTVTCPVPGTLSSITRAASRSAVPFASHVSVSTINPLRFSTSKLLL